MADAWEVIDELHIEVDEIIDVGDGETVVSVQRTMGRTSHMRLDTDVQWAAVWTIRGGKALRAQGYRSKAEALEAAGLAK
jgi:ketosteroid isomerase-like protein